MRSRDFENVRRQIGRCGIWCGGCIVANGALRDLTERYRALLEAYGLPHWGPKEIDCGKLAAALRSIWPGSVLFAEEEGRS